jgi:hypothetical protein
VSTRVKLDGNQVSNIISVRSSIIAHLDVHGERTGHSNPMHLTITRDCKGLAELAPFSAAIKSPNSVTAFVEFQDTSGNTRYTLNLKRAFVADWSLRSGGDQGAPVVETLQLYCGDMELIADTNTKSYLLKAFSV